MLKYLVTLNPNYDEFHLREYGKIIFKSNFLEGLYGIETTYRMEYLKQLPFVKKIENDYVGSFDV